MKLPFGLKTDEAFLYGGAIILGLFALNMVGVKAFAGEETATLPAQNPPPRQRPPRDDPPGPPGGHPGGPPPGGHPGGPPPTGGPPHPGPRPGPPPRGHPGPWPPGPPPRPDWRIPRPQPRPRYRLPEFHWPHVPRYPWLPIPQNNISYEECVYAGQTMGKDLTECCADAFDMGRNIQFFEVENCIYCNHRNC